MGSPENLVEINIDHCFHYDFGCSGEGNIQATRQEARNSNFEPMVASREADPDSFALFVRFDGPDRLLL